MNDSGGPGDDVTTDKPEALAAVPAAAEAGDSVALDTAASVSTPVAPVERSARPQPAARTMRERLWPAGAGRVAFVALALLVCAYVIVVQVLRYRGMWAPWSSDGDQPQAVWQYWRYHVDGAFPPGDVVTDYAFVMHAPPVWWLLMATMSSVIEPLVAAKVLNIVAYALTVIAMWVVVARRTNAFMGLAAVVLLVRNWDFSFIIAGGYARSFGPLLTLCFLGAFLEQRHKLALAILVLQAAFYPSVVIPCGLAYGVYTVVKGPMPLRLRQMAGMFIAGLLIIGFGKFQDLASPSWWGSVVTLEEALEMPAWGPGGRVAEAPLKPALQELPRHFVRAFRPGAHALAASAGGWLITNKVALGGLLVAPLVACIGLAAWRRRRGTSVVDPFPWQPLLLFAAALLSYFLARLLAFKLYVPYRPLQHVWPYMIYVSIPFMAWTLARNLVKREALATLLAFTLAVAPTVLLWGPGVEPGPPTYSSTRHLQRMYDFIKPLPIKKTFAGEFNFVDKIPLFTYHRSYIMKNMAHPFRKGYWAESERRIREMYRALYATRLSEVIAFAEKEHVDYFAVHNRTFTAFDAKLFEPLRKELLPLYRANVKAGIALARAPKSSIVFDDGVHRLIDIQLLKAALAAGEVPDQAPPPPPSPPRKTAPPPEPTRDEPEAPANDDL